MGKKAALIFSAPLYSSLLEDRRKLLFTERGILVLYQIDQAINANME
ncbi:MAG: hypothetical protein KJ990_12745 [Proteobacteria bacterium]|nr:hypothetical protein [Pseudomonadota bacterium]MBU1649720.1 hypothetical protein [Pseudomonadota bacterium]